MSSLGARNAVHICSFPPLVCYHSKSGLTRFGSSRCHTLTLKRCQLNLNIVVLHCTIICTSQYIVDPLSIPSSSRFSNLSRQYTWQPTSHFESLGASQKIYLLKGTWFHFEGLTQMCLLNDEAVIE